MTIQLMRVSATQHPESAADMLSDLMQNRTGPREAVAALAALECRCGRANAAADRLDRFLATHACLGLNGFAELLDTVCAATARPGWISLGGSGMLRISAGGREPAVDLALDGQRLGPLVTPSRRPVSYQMPSTWSGATSLTALLNGRPLLGSGLQPFRFAALDGIVELAEDGAIAGWARLAVEPDVPPSLHCSLREADGPTRILSLPLDRDDGQEDGVRWRFRLGPERLEGAVRLDLTNAAGRALWGSPVFPGAERHAAAVAAAAPHPRVDAYRPLPTVLLRQARPMPDGATRKSPGRCDVIIPVHDGADALRVCLESVQRTLPGSGRLLLVDDGARDPAVKQLLRDAAAAGAVLVRHPMARGFPAAANSGLRRAMSGRPRDVVLLNADTAVPAGWLERLTLAAYGEADIGTCTPLTNDGTMVSYPTPDEPVDMPDPAALATLDNACREANGQAVLDIPTGVGFCLFIKAACLSDVGLLREEPFAQGYGEENDWCLRAAHRGWRNVAAAGVFVAHAGGRSFGKGKPPLMRRNLKVMERLHPGYATYVREAPAASLLAAARGRIDMWRAGQDAPAPSVALVTHDAGGGVARHVAWRCGQLNRAGRRGLVIRPAGTEAAPSVRVIWSNDDTLRNLVFAMPDELAELAAFLRKAGVERVEFHHLLGHHAAMRKLPLQLGVPYDVVTHDYGHWCPRFTLTRRDRYCGEPLAVGECEDCIADYGSRTPGGSDVAGLRQQSALLMEGAEQVKVPCNDVAARVRRHFPDTRPVVAAWEDPVEPGPAPAPEAPGADIRVVVVGAIGPEKGYDALLACGRDAAQRGLPLRFTVVGHTVDDERLMATGRVFVTGRFAEGEGLAIVREEAPTMGFVPSVCPETWSYSLSTLMAAGLPVVAFALGAQAERVRRYGRGLVLPFGLAPDKLNDILVATCRGATWPRPA